MTKTSTCLGAFSITLAFLVAPAGCSDQDAPPPRDDAAAGRAGSSAAPDAQAGKAGGSTPAADGSVAPETGASDAQAADAQTTVVAPAGACPSSLPAAAAACPAVDLVCTYGTDDRPYCRSTATCTSAGWKLGAPVAGSPCATTPGTCPQTPAPNASCSAAGLRCQASDRSCVCLMGALKWACDVRQPQDAACPAALPNAGTACAAKPAAPGCRYGGCTTAGVVVVATCPAGVWTWHQDLCADTGGGA